MQTPNHWVKSKAAARAVLATVAATLWAWSPATYSAAPVEYGRLELRSEAGMQRVIPSFDKAYGTYLGSGTGKATGKLMGTLAWDLYEEQSDSELHRAQFVGWMTARDGSKIAFETTGYFIPRHGASPFWDLTSAVHFSDATGAAYRKFVGRVGLWQGHAHPVNADTYVHTYRLFMAEPTR